MFRVIRFNYNKSNDIVALVKSRKAAEANLASWAHLDPNGHYYIDIVGKV